MNFPLDMFPDCIHFMTLTCFYYYIVYTCLETLLYTVFITTLFNSNYIILFYMFGSKKGRFIGINSIVLT